MKAMIFAAGKGTRLQPVTNNIPKALVEINGIPILEIVIKKLISYGFNEIIVNVHYLSDQIIEFLKVNNNFGINIQISDETDLLLDTGGALKKANWFFSDNKPFLLYNVDIMTNLNLYEMYNFHVKKNCLVTLSVQNRESSRKLFFNQEQLLCGWTNKSINKIIMSRPDKIKYEYAFNGIHIINPDIFKYIYEKGVFSIIDMYLRLASDYNIGFYYIENAEFVDIGTPAQLKIAQEKKM